MVTYVLLQMHFLNMC